MRLHMKLLVNNAIRGEERRRGGEERKGKPRVRRCRPAIPPAVGDRVGVFSSHF
jgi:hypothetical protein